MSARTFAWLSRIREVEREHAAIRFAADHLLRSIHEGSKTLEANLKRLDVQRASGRLQGTYIIRVFAEFEAGLKRFLRARKIKVPRNAKPLIDRVAARTGIAGDPLTNAHAVRRYRNKLVHSLEDDIDPLTMREVTRYLCTFFARLPPIW